MRLGNLSKSVLGHTWMRVTLTFVAADFLLPEMQKEAQWGLYCVPVDTHAFYKGF